MKNATSRSPSPIFCHYQPDRPINEELMNTITRKPLGKDLLWKMDAYWRAANYLFVGLIFFMDNPLFRRALKPEDVQTLLLGHWGNTPELKPCYFYFYRN